jgi:DNA modification methylase
MQIFKIKVADLSNDPANARKHDDRNIDSIIASLRRFGQQKPIVIDASNVVRAGNGTLEAAKRLGWDSIECVKTSLKGSDAIAYAIADNRTAELAEWDSDILAAQLSGLLTDDEALANAAGFSAEEIEAMLSDLAEPTEIDEDEVPEPPVDPITKLGDLWILGEHRVLCGDSTKAEDVARLMGGKRADMVFTDPPYNCADEMSESFYANANSPAMKGLAAAKWDKGFSPDEFLKRVEEIRPDNGTVYVCTSHMLAPEIWSYMEKSKATHSSYLVWCKPNPMPSLAKRHPTWATELICYATFGKHVFNFPEEGHSLSWWSINKNAKNDLHPTQKPVAVPAKAIELSSKPGQVVADLFLGSGTTLVAAEQLGRKCYGMEISPQYCDVIVARWEKLTGQKAVCQYAIPE